MRHFFSRLKKCFTSLVLEQIANLWLFCFNSKMKVIDTLSNTVIVGGFGIEISYSLKSDFVAAFLLSIYAKGQQ